MLLTSVISCGIIFNKTLVRKSIRCVFL